MSWWSDGMSRKSRRLRKKLSTWLGDGHAARTNRHSRRRHWHDQRRLACEELEGRWMLTAVSWVGGASGYFDVASNWSGGAVPTSTDDVSIGLSSPTTVIIQPTDIISIDSLNLSANTTLQVTGGLLTTVAGLTNSGTINVSPGSTITVGGSYIENAGATLSMPGNNAPGFPSSNILTSDAGFETPKATTNATPPGGSWTYFGTSYLSTQYAYAGSQSLVETGNNSGVSQTFAATAGFSYTASVYAMTPASNPLGANSAAQLQVQFFDASQNQITSYSAPNDVVIVSGSSAPGGSLTGSVGNQGWNLYSTTVTAPAGTVSVDVTLNLYAPSAQAASGAVYFDGVTFGLSGSSKMTAGSISNSGLILIGPTNSITTSGNFTQTSTGTLDTQLGGSPSSGVYGSLTVAGVATLAGTYMADDVYSYVPSTIDSFTPVTFASETGNFSSVVMASGAGYQFFSATTFTNIVVAAAPSSAVTTTVNAANVLGSASTSLLGVNTGYWDQSLLTTTTQQLVTAAGITLYRFPGGSDSDDFHFNQSTNLNNNSAKTITQFAQLMASLNGTGIVTLDYGSGSPQEAAAELAYLQGSTTDNTSLGTGIEWNDTTGQWVTVDWKTVGYWASLRAASPLAVDDGLNFMRIAQAAPFPSIKYFEVGNEEYGSWEIDHHGTNLPSGVSTGAQHDPATYAAFAATFASLASEITTAAGLPSIVIGIDSGDPTGAFDSNWTKNVLTAGLALGFVPGFISDHNYMQSASSESDTFLLNDTVTASSSNLDWSTRYATYETLLHQTLGSQASSVQLMATEYNSVSTDPGKQSTSLVNGLFIAESIGSMLSSGYSAGVVWDLRNSYNTTGENNSNSLYGWRAGGDYGLLGTGTHSAPATGKYVAYPNYFAVQLASKLIQTGGKVVSATSNYAGLDTYAVLEANGHLELLVINTNPAADLTSQFNVSGFRPNGAVQVWQYGKTQDTAQSLTTNGTSSLANLVSTLSLNGNNFSYTFPSYSMTVLDLTPVLSVSIGSSAVTFVRGGSGIEVAPDATITDTNTSTLQSATLQITNLNDGAAESLYVPGYASGGLILGTNITATYNAATGTLTLSGTDSLSNYQQVIDAVAYKNTSLTANTTTRTVSITVSDANGSSMPVTRSIAFDLAPKVMGVYVSSSSWDSSYFSYLDTLSSATVTGLGYALPTGSSQFTTLPWLNLNTLSVQFSENVTVTQNSLQLIGSTSLGLPSLPTISGFSYNATTHVATWTFNASLQANRLMIHLAASTITDGAGAYLDGSWTDTVSSFLAGSGTGGTGTDFNFITYVLPGDTSNQQTVTLSQAKQVVPSINLSAGDTGYNYRKDVLGAGTITLADAKQIVQRINSDVSSILDPLAPLNSITSLPSLPPFVLSGGGALFVASFDSSPSDEGDSQGDAQSDSQSDASPDTTTDSESDGLVSTSFVPSVVQPSALTIATPVSTVVVTTPAAPLAAVTWPTAVVTTNDLFDSPMTDDDSPDDLSLIDAIWESIDMDEFVDELADGRHSLGSMLIACNQRANA